MKKWLSLLLVAALTLALLAGCGRDKNNQADTQADPQPAQEQENSTAPENSTAGDNEVAFGDAVSDSQGDSTAPVSNGDAAADQTGEGEWSPYVLGPTEEG